MRVAIVHYHLRPGGVTRVIEQTCAALHDLGIANVVLAENVQGLGYGAGEEPQVLAERLRKTASTLLGSHPDVWIFHNPTLGKNRAIPTVIEHFANEGEAMLLHIHDLAEDGRLANFSNIPDPARLHLTAPRVHHAFINRRDFERFIKAGLPKQRAHLLPNPVATADPVGAILRPRFPQAPQLTQLVLTNETALDASPLVFYPVRGIRRKNLGEVCLLAALAPQGARFAVSRAPENPKEIATHDFWMNFATAHNLPVWFDVADRLAPSPIYHTDFRSWCSASTHWISTSIAEGFGQTLAEAAAIGKPLIARALDPGFSPTDQSGIYRKITSGDESVDFATYGEAAQADVIRHALASPDFAASILIDDRPACEWLDERLRCHQSPASDPQLTAHTPNSVASALISILKQLVRQLPGPPAFLPGFELASLYRDSPPLLNHPRPLGRSDFPRAVIFDIYGTLLDAPPGGVRPDPSIDPAIINFLENYCIKSPAAPTAALAALVAREHAASREAFPEIDLVALWAELLGLPVNASTAMIVAEIEDLWHPATLMPGAAAMLRRLALMNIPCGLLSNAQANAWRQLGKIAPSFASDLCIFSHQYMQAKPSAALFVEMQSRLAHRGIASCEVWFVGNDPENDIAPAKHVGFRTAIYGNASCDVADLRLSSWDAFPLG